MLRYKPNPSQVMHKLKGEFRVHSYTQLTMSYYSQLGKKQNFTVADGTHEMNMANVIHSFHDSFVWP